ncbi:MAG: sigma-70 family RNA polymerase sigma factor [Azospirillaceae bacterium]|nr:sigma-70 family RNA polymerase sigma factor [Azospirillaceae bacterium]
MARDRKAQDLYEAHRAALVAYACGITGNQASAEDVVQDAWLRLHQAEPARALDRPLNYLYRIVRNLAIDGRRRARLERAWGDDDLASIAERVPSDAPSPENAVQASGELRQLLSALDELPERTRRALILHRAEGRTLKEVAAALGISVGLAHGLVADGLKHCARRVPRGT